MMPIGAHNTARAAPQREPHLGERVTSFSSERMACRSDAEAESAWITVSVQISSARWAVSKAASAHLMANAVTVHLSPGEPAQVSRLRPRQPAPTSVLDGLITVAVTSCCWPCHGRYAEDGPARRSKEEKLSWTSCADVAERLAQIARSGLVNGFGADLGDPQILAAADLARDVLAALGNGGRCGRSGSLGGWAPGSVPVII